MTPTESPFDRARREGASAPDLGEAFYAGYQAALRALVPSLRGPASLAVTEEGGNHPRAIRTTARFEGGTVQLDGIKSFVTGADRAETILVAATDGTRSDGTPSIVVIRVDPQAPGVALEPLPEAPFAPSIRHARLHLRAVTVPAAARVGEDGYRDVVKPFRTVEDIHVVAAVAAHLGALVAKVAGPEANLATELLESALASLESLARRPADDPAVHRALAGTLGQVRATLDPALTALEPVLDGPVHRALQRDRALLRVAEGARVRRTELAHAARLRGAS